MKSRTFLLLCLDVALNGFGVYCLFVSFMVDGVLGSLQRDPDSIFVNTELARAVPGSACVAVPELLRAMRDEDARTRSGAAYSLAFFHPNLDSVMPQFILMLGDHNPGIRWDGARVVGRYRAAGEAAVPALIAGMQEERATEVPGVPRRWLDHNRAASPESDSVRTAFAETLGEIGPAAEAAVPALTAALRDRDPMVRFTAAVALWRITHRAAAVIPVLTQALEEERIRAHAAQALGEIGPEAKGAVPALRKAFKDKKAAPAVNEALDRIAGRSTKPGQGE